MHAFVAVDCETTGLDPARDELLEIAAVRVEGTARAEWSTLVRPAGPIPLFVQRLTGITPEDVRDAPVPEEALRAFRGFVGELPVVAHHAAFDAAVLDGALGRAGLPPLRVVWDTLLLARLVDPLAPAHRLKELAERYGVVLDRAHRALEDARATAVLFEALLRRAADLEPAVRGTLATLLASEPPGPARALADLLGPPGPPVVRLGGAGGRSPEAPPRAEAVAWDEASLAGLLEPGSPLAQALGGLEPRPGQVRMLRAVWRALEAGRHLVVEAGTGTGKTLAYLLPALAWARARGRRVVVSTETVALQEQIVERDLPTIARASGLPARVALLKGRGHYLCLKAWQEALAGDAPGEGAFRARLAAWLAATETGDKAELGLHGEEEERFAALSADAVACTGRRCPFYDPCFLFRARRRAEAADVVVANHALVFSDLAKGPGSVLPEYDVLVLDEAHHAEDAASEHLGPSVTARGLERFFRLVERSLRHRGAEEGSSACRVALGRAREAAVACWAAVRRWALEAAPPYGERWTVRLGGPEGAPGWGAVRAEGERLGASLADLARALDAWARALAAEDPERAAELGELARGAGEAADGVRLCLEGREGWVAWAEVAATGGPGGEAVTLRTAPVAPADALAERLFARKHAVVLTSATLAVGGDCRFLRERLGLAGTPEAERADELLVGSPFDYRRQCLLAVPTDLPSLVRPEELREGLPRVAEWLLAVLRASRGHALVLCTSHRLLRALRAALKPGLEAEGIACLAQGVDGHRGALARVLRANEEAVVLGAASFWEGVDVPGPGLRLVVVAQLPFLPPDRPLEAARQEAVRARGRDPFRELQLPLAVLRFKQGFGRLIRSARDEGVVLVLDRRLVTASYGRVFLASLPDPQVRVGPAADLLPVVTAALTARGPGGGSAAG